MDYKMLSSSVFRSLDDSDFSQFKCGSLLQELYCIFQDSEEKVSSSFIQSYVFQLIL